MIRIFNDRITLLDISDMRNDRDEDDFPVLNLTNAKSIEIWAEKHSVTRTEFYSAGSIGIEAVIAFKVHTDDYDNQTLIMYENQYYEVRRTYAVSPGVIDLTCTDKSV